MDKNIFLYAKGVGIITGLISILTLISKHPINVGFILLGAAVYFGSDYLSKKL